MKVLMLGWEFPPHISGGLGTACQGICEGLAHHGVHAHFVLPRAHGDEGGRVLGCERVLLAARGDGDAAREAAAGIFDTLQLGSVASPLRAYESREEYARRRGIEPDDGGPYAFRGGYGDDLFEEVERYAVAVAGIARDLDFDVIHAHDWMTWPAGLVIRRETGRPLVCHVHATEYDRRGEAPDPGIRRVESLALAAADLVVCVSRYTARVVQTRYGVDPTRVRVVHNAVRAWCTESGPDSVHHAPTVLFLGRVTRQKGPSYFLEAAARVAALHPTARFVISGDGDLLPDMIEHAARLGLGRRVRFTGFLDGDDVGRMYERADVFVMPSVSEPFGIAPLEAASLGVPTIVSRQSGVSETLASTLKFDYWDVEDLADKILAVLHHAALRRQLSEEGREEVGGLHWETVGQKLIDVYGELVS